MTTGGLRRAIKAMRGGWLRQPVLIGLEWGLMFIGIMFWLEARLSSEAFNEALYGKFALQFPAEIWAALMMGGAAMTLIGLRDPVRRGMVIVGGSIMTLQFLGLAYSSIATGGEFIVGAFCSVIFAPLHLVMVWESVKHGDD